MGCSIEDIDLEHVSAMLTGIMYCRYYGEISVTQRRDCVIYETHVWSNGIKKFYGHMIHRFM